MYHKIPKEDRIKARYFLDPSAGSGFIIEYLKENYRRIKYHDSEKDPDLMPILRGKKNYGYF
jgi:hypothetical protein